jgi:hypothetical protein
MIPNLRPDGTLPPGEFHATIAEVLAAFPATTPERTILNQALQDALPTLQHLKIVAPDAIIYLNGSYATTKPDPNDIDLLVLTNQLSENQVIALFQ